MTKNSAVIKVALGYRVRHAFMVGRVKQILRCRGSAEIAGGPWRSEPGATSPELTPGYFPRVSSGQSGLLDVLSNRVIGQKDGHTGCDWVIERHGNAAICELLVDSCARSAPRPKHDSPRGQLWASRSACLVLEFLSGNRERNGHADGRRPSCRHDTDCGPALCDIAPVEPFNGLVVEQADALGWDRVHF